MVVESLLLDDDAAALLITWCEEECRRDGLLRRKTLVFAAVNDNNGRVEKAVTVVERVAKTNSATMIPL
jgi:hypothetical protein